MKASILSPKESLWLNCKEKSCCSHYSVILTGLDIWRISQAMQLPPWIFTVYTDAPPSADDGFALDASDRRYQVILAKRHVKDQTLSPCIFLWRLADGHAQCGLGELRPGVCKTFPSILADGILCMGDSSGCSCRTWALAHVDIEQETQLVQDIESSRREYSDIVQRWNTRVQKTGDARQYSYMEFCNYLVNIYADRYRWAEQDHRERDLA